MSKNQKLTDKSLALGSEIKEILRDVLSRPENRTNATERYVALSYAVRKRLSERWVKTQLEDQANHARRIYYMSMEYLIGRSLNNALAATGLKEAAKEAVRAEGYEELSDLLECEHDAALGNGGLGRLAACFLDSMATLELPSWGYGMRYEYGMFAQSIVNGCQVERPDQWLVDGGTVWEFPRYNTSYTVRFGGKTEARGVDACAWLNATEVTARAYDFVIPGHGTDRVSTMRLWKAFAPEQIDLNAFNTGDYARASGVKNQYENISWVLYPNDSTPRGRELRLKQEYLFVSASMQDILKHHLGEYGTLENLSDKIAIHLNDTHPAISVAELMRLLVDEHSMSWKDAWAQCAKIFSYTNHTLMPEALETWPVPLMKSLLPRHMEIIYRINAEFLAMVREKFPGDIDLVRRVSLIDDGNYTEESKRVRMSHLSIVASHKVNGVSKLHSALMVKTIFSGFARIFPDRFDNKTNGITQRRWLAEANPGLAAVLDKYVGTNWRYNLDDVAGLRKVLASGQADAICDEFLAVKRANKERLASYVRRTTGVEINPAAMMDVQVKRIHEYKRQLLNVLHVIALYNNIKDGRHHPARNVIFSGKAASSYYMAKLIIRLINDVARIINADPAVGGKLKVAFVPNYSVSAAEVIIPAADLSEQISTAGTEASGTGNMKLALNGALTMGTEDGATIEIRDSVGAENVFIFGNTASQIDEIRRRGYNPRVIYQGNARLRRVMDMIRTGYFSPEQPERYADIFAGLVDYGDYYMLLADFESYVAAQERAEALYADPKAWAKKALLNVAGMGPFSSDRTIRDYARDTWNLEKYLRK